MCKAFAAAQEAPVIGDAAQNHIGFREVFSCHVDLQRFGIKLTFVEVERPQVDLVGEAVVKAAVVADDFLDDPRCGAAANDEHDVVAHVGPTIPKVFQGTDKLRFGCVHPRQFVQKDHFLLVRRLLEQVAKEVEGLKPSAGHLAAFQSGLAQRLAKLA